MDEKSYLTELEANEIHKFVNNPIQFEAVRKILLTGLYSNGTLRKGVASSPTRNMAFTLVANIDKEVSNEQVGADLRALWYGINALEGGFNELKRMARVVEPPKEKKEGNPAL
jgi:hypothetical protein